MPTIPSGGSSKPTLQTPTTNQLNHQTLLGGSYWQWEARFSTPPSEERILFADDGESVDLSDVSRLRRFISTNGTHNSNKQEHLELSIKCKSCSCNGCLSFHFQLTWLSVHCCRRRFLRISFRYGMHMYGPNTS